MALWGNKASTLSFEARIRKGAAVFQDFSLYRWPEVDEHVDLTFRVTQNDWNLDTFTCRAHGYGELGGSGYGNGALMLAKFDDLLIADNKTRQELIAAKRARLQKEYREKAEEMRELNAKIASLR